MAKVIFTISYDVNPEKREQYLALTKQMKDYIMQSNGKEYAIFEQKGKKNSFSEVFIFNSMEDYEQMDDQDEKMNEFMGKLEDMLAGGKMRYSTLVELS